jgi:predicted nucleic acid-binding Zn ribbon protein
MGNASASTKRAACSSVSGARVASSSDTARSDVSRPLGVPPERETHRSSGADVAGFSAWAGIVACTAACRAATERGEGVTMSLDDLEESYSELKGSASLWGAKYCQLCSKPLQGAQQRWCSLACKKKGFYKRHSPRIGKVKNCKWHDCGKPFQPRLRGGALQRYCSSKCREAHRSFKRRGTKPFVQVILKCAAHGCLKHFERTDSAHHREMNYCSKRCYQRAYMIQWRAKRKAETSDA